MKQIAPSTSSYLLEAPLEILHRESFEWIEEIKFWKDEVDFFYKIIGNKHNNGSEKLNTAEAKEIEKHLIYVSSQSIDELRNEAIAHEKFLDSRQKNTMHDEPVYRSRHRSLAAKFQNFEHEFKEMKKKIFQLVEASNTAAHH